MSVTRLHGLRAGSTYWVGFAHVGAKLSQALRAAPSASPQVTILHACASAVLRTSLAALRF